MSILAVIILAIAVSLDSISVGIAYGLRDIKIPIISRMVIALATSIAMLVSLTMGNFIQSLLSPFMAKIIGAFILFGMGVWMIAESVAQDKSNKQTKESILTIRLKPLGLVVQVLKEPVIADIDTSGTIDTNEAFLLGFALALDAFGVGLGAAVAGLNAIFMVIFVTAMSFLLLSLGLYYGKKKKSFISEDKMKYIPGGLLIVIALIKALVN